MRGAERTTSTIRVITTGGTIASHFDGNDWANVDGRVLVDDLGDLAAHVTLEEVHSGPSSSLSVEDMLAIVRRIGAAAQESAGVVITHGTDTIELTSFLTEIVLGTTVSQPVVFTGSMRVHSHPHRDGTANMRDSITVASSAIARDREVMVCLDGRVHASSRVHKVSAASVDAFSSAPFEPIGALDGSEITFTGGTRPVRPSFHALDHDVPLLTCYPGMPADVFERAAAGMRGIVLEGFGNLNVPRNLWAGVHRAASAGTLVIVTSRPFTDAVRRDGFDELGAIGAGGLTAQKARLVAMAALGSTGDRDAAVRFVEAFALQYSAGERGTT